MISGADVVGAQSVSFVMLVAPTLPPCGIIERSWGTWDRKKGDLGVQAWISVDFGWIAGPHSESCSLMSEQHMCLSWLVFGYLKAAWEMEWELQRLHVQASTAPFNSSINCKRFAQSARPGSEKA